MVFGYMGVASLPISSLSLRENSNMRTTVDYKKSISQVYADFARDIIEWCQGIEILTFVEDLDLSERRPGLPSWAPDWSVGGENKSQPITHKPMSLDSAKGFASTCYGHPIHYWIPNSSLLALEALDLETVVSLSVSIPRDARELINLGELEGLFSEDVKYLLEFCDGDHYIKFHDIPRTTVTPALLKSYIHDIYARAIGVEFLSPLGGIELQNFHSLSHVYGPEEEKREFFDLLLRYTFKKERQSILAGRRIAVLGNGRKAIVPSSSRIGDVMARLDRRPEFAQTFIFRAFDGKGAFPPEILDESERNHLKHHINDIEPMTDSGHFKLIGEAYMEKHPGPWRTFPIPRCRLIVH